jgi:hypothetical protein
MTARAAALALLLTLTTSVHALDLAGRDLFIPVAGRTPGAAGTFWQTDLVITSLSPEYGTLRVRVDFDAADGNRESFDVDVPSGGSTVIEDFVRTKLGRDAALGTIRITAASPDAQLTAQAVVHNTGGDEPLGQTVQALPLAALHAQSLIGGLLVENGHRSNVGVANPHDEPVQVRFSPPHGLQPVTVTVAPHGFVQMDARAAAMSLEGGSRAVLVSATRPVYAYGSVIRGGDGDPQFVLPVETRASSTFAVAPACTSPAPLHYAIAPAPGYIVVFHPGQNVEAVTAELAARHGFTPISVFAAIGLGFYAELTPAQLAALRCEPVIDYIEQNAWTSAAGAGTVAETWQKATATEH